MAQPNRVMDNLKDVSHSASTYVNRAQGSLNDLRNRGREVLTRARGKMTTQNWVALGFSVAAIGFAFYYARRNRGFESNIRDFVE